MKKLVKNTHQETVKPTPPNITLLTIPLYAILLAKTHNHITKNGKTLETHNLKILVQTKNVIYLTYNRNILFSQKALCDIHIIYPVTNLKILCI